MNNAVRDARLALASLPIFAQALAGQTKVEVVIDARASTAMTDGQRIIIPALPLPANESDVDTATRLVTLVRGFIPHEIGHVHETDFGVMSEAGQSGGAALHSILNAIEDPRQEASLIRRYRGTRKQLDEMTEALIGTEGFYNRLEESDDPSWLIGAYVLYSLRGSIRDQRAFEELAEQSRPALVARFGERLVSSIDVLVNTFGTTMRSTKDAYDLAKRLIKAIEDEQQNLDPPPPAAESDPNAQQDGESDDSSGQAGGDSGDEDSDSQPQGGGGDGEDSGDSDQEGGGSDQDGGGDSNGSGADDGTDQADGSSGGSGGPEDPSAAKKALQDVLDGNGEGVRDLGDQLADQIKADVEELNPRSNGAVYEAPLAIEDGGGRATTGMKIDDVAAIRQSSRLRAVMKQELQSMQLQRDHESVRGTVLNQRRIHRTSSGDRRIFLHQDERRELNTAVFLLCDVSSSMNGERIKLASEALYAAAAALNDLTGVTTAVGVFPGYRLALRFGERAIPNKEHFGLHASGNTPLAQGVAWASRHLMQRQELRKVLLVASDGQPSCVPSALAQIQAAEAAGIETMGLGIELPQIKSIFETSETITALEELAPAMMSMLRNTLRTQLQAA